MPVIQATGRRGTVDYLDDTVLVEGEKMSELAELFEDEPVETPEAEAPEEVAETVEEPTPAVEEAPEPDTPPAVIADEEQGGPTPPEKRETGTVPIAALLDERDKRQQLQRQLEQFQAQPKAEPQPEKPSLAFPTLESVGYDESAFQQAVHTYNQANFDAQFSAHQEKLDQQRQEQEMAAKLNDFWAKGAEIAPDFQLAVVSNDNLYVSDIMRDAAIESTEGAAVLYYLGTHPDQSARIQGLSPARQAAEIGKLEERLSTKPAPVAPAAETPAPVLSPSLTNIRAEGGNRETVSIPDPFDTTFNR